MAHGGHCVARSDNRVVFVRHALPGELALVEITASGPKGRYARGDATEIVAAHALRRQAPCPFAGPGGCGGCDWQHASPELARQLKADVVVEAMARFAGVALPADFEVRDIGEDPDGLGWRTRAWLSVGPDGRAGLLRHRSGQVVALTACPQLVDPQAAGAFARSWSTGPVRYVAPSVGSPMCFPAGQPRHRTVLEQVGGRRFQVDPEGFWQAHRRAAHCLAEEVVLALAARPGERVVDLYSGVGLLGISLAAAMGGTCPVRLVEADRTACRLAVRNAAGLPVTVIRAQVNKWVTVAGNLRDDLVILDPPRSGAGRATVAAILAHRPRRVVYVACDPVALARDVADVLAAGYRLDGLVGLDLFPNTHHVECVAAFEAILS